jgi:hypothetical protein
MMNLDPTHLAWRSTTAEQTRQVLNELEAELAAVKHRRDAILIDISKANAASVRGQRARMELPRLNKEEIALGRVARSIEVQIGFARKRVTMVDQAAANQAAARAAESGAHALVRDKLSRLSALTVARVRHRGASLEDVRRRLQNGYTVAGQVHGADDAGNGGFIPRPGFLTAMLEAYNGEFEAWLAERGVKFTAAENTKHA